MVDEPTPIESDEKQDAPAGEGGGSDAGPPTETAVTAADAAPEPAPAEPEPAAEAPPDPGPPAEAPAVAEAPPEPVPAPIAEAPPEPAPAAKAPPEPADEAPPEPAAEQQAATDAQPAAEQQAATDAQPAPEQQAATDAEPAAGGGKPGRGQGKPRRDRPRRERGPGKPGRDRGGPRQQQRPSGPLPFQELRDAAAAVVELFGARQTLRDAFAALGEKERRDLARLVAEDGDWRVRARNIAAGSLGAGRVGKALAAQQISMARVEDLWPLTLSREEAAERQSRVRSARQRDERRSQRDAEREQRSDRVSRAELEKAQDGRVGAQIRIVIGGQPRDRKRKGDDAPKDDPKPGGSDVLDRLGY
jgi:hypothetical protein